MTKTFTMKAFAGAVVALVMFSFVALPIASALTTAQVSAIVSLLQSFGADAATVANVQATLNGQPTSGGSVSVPSGLTVVAYAGNGQAAKDWQTAFNSFGYTPALVVDGITGSKTRAATRYFQTNYGGLAVDGVYGPLTTAAMNAWLAGNGTPNQPPVYTGGTANAALSASTPGSATIADAANANALAFNLSAGGADLTVSSIWVTRSGLSANADLENVKILDSNGVNVGNTASSFNSNNKAKVTFTPSIVIPAGTSEMFYARVGVVDSTTAGTTFALGINSASDVAASTNVGGSFPIVGNVMTVAQVTIGSVTVAQDGSTSDNTPDVGDTNVILNKFKISAGATEDIMIEQIIAEKKGSAGTDDTTNIELYDRTSNTSLATVSSWNAQGYAVFNNLNMTIEEGDTNRFEIRADVIDGPGLTINADVTDGSEPRVVAKGADYGFYITPTNGSWASSFDGQGSSNQTVNSAAFTIAKSSATPAAGNIAPGDDRLVAVFDAIVTGEETQISSFKVSFNLTTITDSQISNARLRLMSDGSQVSGPNTISTTDYTANSTTYEGTATFTDIFSVNTGTTQLGVYVDIADAVTSGTITAAIADADTDITAKGLVSNDSVTAAPSASNVSGNALTAQAGTLAAVTLTSPAAQNVVVGTNDFVWAELDLSAANSGEDVEVTALVIEATLGAATNDADNLNNFEIWADMSGTGNDSSRGDRYETKVSDTKQFADSAAADETLEFTLTQAITVVKDSSVRLAVVGDLAAGATTTETYTISLDTDSGDVTANGVDTGESITLTPTGAGQTMSADAGGALTVSVDSSSPNNPNITLDDGTSQGDKVTLGIFRLAASADEGMDLDSFKITDDGATTAGEPVLTYYFQAYNKNGTTAVGPEKAIAGGATATAYWNDGEVTVPADSHVLIKVMADVANITTSGLANGDTVIVTVAADNTDVVTTGLSSGTTINGGGSSNYDAATFTIYESYPTFEWQALSSTVLSPSANALVGKLKVTANGDEDITFTLANANKIVFQFDYSTTDINSADADLVTFKNDGITLGTQNSSTILSGTKEVTLNFASSTPGLTVAAGQSEIIEIFYDSVEMEDDGDSLSVWLDTTAADLDFGVDGANFTNAEADVLWRGDYISSQYSSTMVNPS